MCGIVGLFDYCNGDRVEERILQSMTKSLAHRGPDAFAVEIRKGIGLGHTRLSIIDLSPDSNQPFISEDRNLTLVFNGEIFNYIELRDELKSLGRHFRTSSDTEVLLQAYEQWGSDCVPKLNGMWAFAVYDEQKNELFCSRDRFGVKPFNYIVQDGKFIFASESKAILTVPWVKAKPNFDALSLILRKSISAQNSETCFVGIMRLPPAHNLLVTTKGVTEKRYWDYPTTSRKDLTPETAANDFRTILTDAVKLRLRSDVPLGITLSSGLDSTVIATLAVKQTSAPIHSFTAAYGNNQIDESAIATATALRIGIVPHLVAAEPGDFLQVLRKIIWHMETPHASPAIMPLWNIMAYATKRVKVVLEGQGADELLAGYAAAYFGHACLSTLYRRNPIAALRELICSWPVVTWNQTKKKRSNLKAIPWFIFTLVPGAHGVYRRFRGDENVYIGGLASAASKYIGPQRPPCDDHLNGVLRESHEGTLVNLLHYGDAMSMAHGVESRVPFMDYRLVEFAFTLPSNLKYFDGETKKVLRDAFSDVVPESISREKGKIGFYVPIDRWFRESRSTTIDPVLFSKTCKDRGVFDTVYMERIVDKHIRGKADYSNLIFKWITTELWFQIFVDHSESAAEVINQTSGTANAASRAI